MCTYCCTFISEILRRIPATDRACFKIAVQDSYETGGPNWTDDMSARFAVAYEYSPIPYLPVLQGEMAGNRGQSDEISGEFWSEGSLGDIENRAASSCAHIYGKKKVWAESFTCGGNAYSRYSRIMKQRGDRFFTEGINSSLLHLYIQQPVGGIKLVHI